ncbi:MAG: VWA domain-containing protein [Pyrinomonadaceae bacterium]|nr:VWA domain-containing protein [Pyrinomonadaceae bacterium]
MKFALLLIFLLAPAVSAQSGRVKPTETPSPTPAVRRPVYVPQQDRPRMARPTPTPTPAGEEEDVQTINSVLVPIPVSVTDANGRAVTNLKISDFELKVDGKAVEIGELARSESPVRLAMLFDNSSSVMAAREFEKKAAVRFFRRVLRPEKDLAALFSVSTVTRLEAPFTKDISAITGAIEAFPKPEGATALLEGIVLAAEYLGDIDGRRVIIIVSDGDDTKSDVTFEQSLRAVQIRNVQIYVVRTTGFENFIRTGNRSGNANIRQLAAERRMSEFTRQTGGSVYLPIDEDELDDAFDQISVELSQQYILSYYPEEGDGKRGDFRTLSVSVKNRPDLTIRTRNGYYVR